MPLKLTLKTTGQSFTRTDLLVVFSSEGAVPELPSGVILPTKVLDSYKGEEREVRFVDPVEGTADRVLLIGLGAANPIDPEVVRRCGAIAVKKAEKTRATSATLWFDLPDTDQASAIGQALAEGAVMGSYRLADFQSAPEPASLKKITIQGNSAEFKRGVERGEIIGAGNCLARRLQDTPGNRMRPRDLVAEAKKIAKLSDQVTVEVLDEAAMKDLGMGSLLSVSLGSAEPASLIHLVYRPKKKAGRKVCLVGKGLTFDAGGISLKPSLKMEDMKYDMSGGAAVLGTFQALAELVPDGVEVHGLVPASENLPDGKANKPGDLVTAMNGLTIEILNTDAEGRLILADALAYAVEKIKPDAMIDLATLTGAVVMALGHELSGLMGNDQSVIDALVASGLRTGEQVWPLPLLDCHKREMKGQVGDLKNITTPGFGAGSSAGGAFLSNFVSDIPWAHLDIAGSAWGAADRDYQGGSLGTGVGVRLLVDYLENSMA